MHSTSPTNQTQETFLNQIRSVPYITKIQLGLTNDKKPVAYPLTLQREAVASQPRDETFENLKRRSFFLEKEVDRLWTLMEFLVKPVK